MNKTLVFTLVLMFLLGVVHSDHDFYPHTEEDSGNNEENEDSGGNEDNGENG